MNAKLVRDIADAVLYEGYVLYPYRASSVKNRQRWNFGVLYPRAFIESQSGNDRWNMQTECLARMTGESATMHVTVRFLQLLERTRDEELSRVWQEGTEREVGVAVKDISQLNANPMQRSFAFDGGSERDGSTLRRWASVQGAIAVEARALDGGLFKICVRVSNTAPLDEGIAVNRDAALLRSLVSAHTILDIDGAKFISLLEPPDGLRELAAQCSNEGTWPVLVGEDGAHDAILSSPIILYDYPKIAPESAGSLFDGTEIDEILTLRIMTLTDQEKAEMSQDERTRQILERTELMPPEQLLKMHGAWRGISGPGQETP